MPKVKSKKLTVTVIDIKAEVSSNYKVNQVIAELNSEEVEKRPIIFGKGEKADVKFDETNLFLAD